MSRSLGWITPPIKLRGKPQAPDPGCSLFDASAHALKVLGIELSVGPACASAVAVGLIIS
jgi:hypothetical protein